MNGASSVDQQEPAIHHHPINVRGRKTPATRHRQLATHRYTALPAVPACVTTAALDQNRCEIDSRHKSDPEDPPGTPHLHSTIGATAAELSPPSGIQPSSSRGGATIRNRPAVPMPQHSVKRSVPTPAGSQIPRNKSAGDSPRIMH